MQAMLSFIAEFINSDIHHVECEDNIIAGVLSRPTVNIVPISNVNLNKFLIVCSSNINYATLIIAFYQSSPLSQAKEPKNL